MHAKKTGTQHIYYCIPIARYMYPVYIAVYMIAAFVGWAFDLVARGILCVQCVFQCRASLWSDPDLFWSKHAKPYLCLARATGLFVCGSHPYLGAFASRSSGPGAGFFLLFFSRSQGYKCKSTRGGYSYCFLLSPFKGHLFEQK